MICSGLNGKNVLAASRGSPSALRERLMEVSARAICEGRTVRNGLNAVLMAGTGFHLSVTLFKDSQPANRFLLFSLQTCAAFTWS